MRAVVCSGEDGECLRRCRRRDPPIVQRPALLHGGEKFIRPWLDRTGRDLRDTGIAGEQGDWLDDPTDSTFADRALESLERHEDADLKNPWGSTASS